MKLEVGKRYRNGTGEVILIVAYDRMQAFPYMGDDGVRYLSDGRINEPTLASTPRWNLISEVPDDLDPKWEALLEVLRELAEGNESAQHAVRRLKETFAEQPK